MNSRVLPGREFCVSGTESQVSPRSAPEKSETHIQIECCLEEPWFKLHMILSDGWTDIEQIVQQPYVNIGDVIKAAQS